VLQPSPAELDDNAAAEVDSRGRRRLQGLCKVTTNAETDNRRRDSASRERRLTVKRLVLAAALVAAVVTGSSLATPPSGLVREVLGTATLAPFHVQSSDVKLHAKDTADVVTQRVTIAPGGHTGWHTHFGPGIILVKSGTVTLYHGDDPTCTGQRYSAGEGFVEPGNDVHIGRNESATTPVEIISTYLNVPIGGSVGLSVDSPGNCPF
jgi:quercetin dioxygenase-like cupin family protein